MGGEGILFKNKNISLFNKNLIRLILNLRKWINLFLFLSGLKCKRGSRRVDKLVINLV